MCSDFAPLVERVEEVVGDALLGVGRYDGGSYEVLYISDGFAERYPEDRLEEIARDMYLEHLSNEYQKTLLYDFGELNATVRLFDRGLAIQVPTSDSTGFAFGIERAALPVVDELVDACRTLAPRERR
ncbi:hypothetical protein [Halegenticoccus tardaugens]|uniref:hypothetical protein n=1 Tax=Halegenticoccus tardaugens TaxID=2071624 RepID=UPI00100A72EE|nr:hypothetical protein [Halegenticoccus tardaugens]